MKGEAGGRAGGRRRLGPRPPPSRPARPAPTGRPGGRGQPPGELRAARARGAPRPPLPGTAAPRPLAAVAPGRGDCSRVGAHARRGWSRTGVPRLGAASHPPLLRSGWCWESGAGAGGREETWRPLGGLCSGPGAQSPRSSPLTQLSRAAGLQMGCLHFHIIFAFQKMLLKGKLKVEGVGGGGAVH